MDKHHWRHNLHACTWAEFRGLVLKFAPQYIYIHTNLYSAKNRENESEALTQDD